MRPRARRRLIVAMAAVLLAVAADRALKAWYYGRTYRYYEAGEVYWEDSQTLLMFSPDRFLFWRPKPSITLHLEETPQQYGLFHAGTRPVPYAFTLHTIPRGLNTPPFDCEKPADVFRIVILGDSRTMAEGVPWADVYARWRELLRCRPDAVTLLFGINDQDRAQRVSDRQKAVIFDSAMIDLQALLNRSMLVYQARRTGWQLKGMLFGKTPAVPVRYGSAERPVRRVSFAEYRQNLERVVSLGRANGFQTLLLAVPTSPYAYEPSLADDADEEVPAPARDQLQEAQARLSRADPRGAMEVLRDLLEQHPRLTAARFVLAQCHQALGEFDDAQREFLAVGRRTIFARYEDVARAVASQEGASFVDLTEECSRIRREPLYVDANTLGHELIAQALAAALRPAPASAGKP